MEGVIIVIYRVRARGALLFFLSFCLGVEAEISRASELLMEEG